MVRQLDALLRFSLCEICKPEAFEQIENYERPQSFEEFEMTGD